MTKSGVEQLKRKRFLQVTKLESFKDEIDNFSKLNLTAVQILEIEGRMTNAKQIYDEFNRVQNEIELKAETESLTEEVAERISVEKVYFSTMAQAKLLLNSNSPVKLQNAQSSSEQNIKLPTIKLPVFDGNYNSWLEFKDTFTSLIHENQSISEIQKFHYLRAALKDNAATIISSIEFSAPNYNIAWETLLERYNNEDLLVFNHISALLDLNPIKKGTAENLKDLVDAVSKHLRSLQVLKEPVEHWDTLLIQIIVRKLDMVTTRNWEEYKMNNKKSNFEEFRKFLINRAIMLESLEKNDINIKTEKEKFKTSHAKGPTKGAFVAYEKENICTICRQNHWFFNCKEFLNMTPQQRLERAFRSKLCLNCLKTGHVTKKCTSSHCKRCQGKHNTILHGAKFSEINSNQNKTDSTKIPDVQKDQNDSTSQSNKLSANHSYTPSTPTIILPTAMVCVLSKNGKKHMARALLDSGAQGSFITEKAAKAFSLNIENLNTQVVGISNVTTKVSGTTKLKIASQDSSFVSDLSCLVLPNITSFLPNKHFDPTLLKIPKIKLADPSFNSPGPIDLLLGSDIFWKIIKPVNEKFLHQFPYLTKTIFGWVVAGPINDNSNYPVRVQFSKIPDIQEQLQKFWEIEEINTTKPMSPDEVQCENHFRENTIRESDGRFRVKIPFKYSTRLLGNSEERAKKRFLFLEQKLQRNTKLRDYYIDFLREYEKLGHMEEVTNSANFSESGYFMPHHGVLKEDRSTTKLRVVFNASMPTTTNYSLNDLQYTGPTIQEDLFSIVIRFRSHQIAISADIKKMYRQVKVDKNDADFQKIFWRESPEEQLKVYKLTTVTYGTTAGSFLAIRCLKQLADEHNQTHPKASKIIESDFYVDDLITGANSSEEAEKICQEVSEILKKGCFELRKWKSNEPLVLKNCSVETSPEIINLNKDDKTLGLLWSSQNDTLMFKIKWETFASKKTTKRSVLSNVSKIFDPLGLISPCILYAKILLQKLWLLKLSWDDPLPEEAQKIWSKYLEHLPILNDLMIPRKVICTRKRLVQLHCFSDASQTAYGGCIYVRSQNDAGEVMVRLLCSKARVAPLKTLTVPKLELCGAHLVSKLLFKVIKSLKIEIDSCILWTDSTIVLGWIKTAPCQLKTFVSNRISEIQEKTQNFVWKHIDTNLNPADLLTRGTLPDKLKENNFWWEGPEFLKLSESEWPNSKMESSQKLPELKQEIKTFVTARKEIFDFERFSSLIKLKRTVAYILRFKFNCLSRERKTGNLSVDEINSAFQKIIKIIQLQFFASEIENLQKGQTISKDSKILNLAPFLDSHGLLRVGGRLKNSNYEFNKKHPLLLPSNHHLSILIIRHCHLSLYHAGPLTLLSSVREKFWILSGRNLAKKIVNSCVQCRRYNPKPLTQLMGELPVGRVTPGYPFQITGVDYAGPFFIKNHKGRGSKTSKAWICLFICLKTRSIHLELVTSLATEEFLASFRRFVARRGRPCEMYSDNGTNFVGANTELKKLFKNTIFQSAIIDAAATQNINWHFSPPKAPHMGGMWEAGVKACKRHLQRIMGNSVLTFEEFYTILTEVEAILNSRPLTPLSSNPNDLQPLTPSHFLIGRTATSLPDPDLTNVQINKLSRYQLLRSLSQHFWKRWHQEYISELQIRVKWKTRQRDLQIGDLVIIKEDKLPPKSWCLGRIVHLHPGKDGIFRVADIRTSKGVLRRPLTKICILLDD